MEQSITVLIIVHATFGGVALLAGLVSMASKKGLRVHRTSGSVFYYSMLVSALMAMIITFLPNHESPFLLAVGIFSLYFLLTGKRALKYKKGPPDLRIDRCIAAVMIVVACFMLFLPRILAGSVNIVLCVFGMVGIIFSVRDLIAFNRPEKLKKRWLKLHLGKMMGAYISAATAFVVVNEFFSGLYAWFLPGIIGGFFIAYWIRKLNKAERSKISV